MGFCIFVTGQKFVTVTDSPVPTDYFSRFKGSSGVETELEVLRGKDVVVGRPSFSVSQTSTTPTDTPKKWWTFLPH